MDCIFLTQPIGYFSINKAKNISFQFGCFKTYVKNGKTSMEKLHVEILTLIAITTDFRISLSKGWSKQCSTPGTLKTWWNRNI